MSGNKEKFDLIVVHDNFLTSLHQEDDVFLNEYLNSYDELNKFFSLMGSLFNFVSTDLKVKMDILFDLLKNDQDNKFKTVKSMIAYEMENNLLYKNGYVSGSRTLLRLHRGLDFIRLFLKNLGNIKDDEETGSICRQAYNETLAKYHPYLVRKGAQLAMFTMPSRGFLLKKVCGDAAEDIKNTINILPQTLEVTGKVYQRIDNLYTLHDLHNLP